jgi:hypothetical protein
MYDGISQRSLVGSTFQLLNVVTEKLTRGADELQLEEAFL